MGASNSKSECQDRGVSLFCGLNATHVGRLPKGEVQPDGDIAGIGIVSAFIGVTAFAFILALISVLFTLAKFLGWKSQKTDEERLAELEQSPHHQPFSLTDLCETLILPCADQQIFTGGAYAITLRYFKGCVITAYHYNIVANIMLLTCATHLLTVTIVRAYWRFPWLGWLRVVLTLLLFLSTGLLLANQNAKSGDPFPTGLPNAPESTASMFLPAACYQDARGLLPDTLDDSFGKGAKNFADILKNSQPGNKIQGWNYYIVILLFYGAALVMEVFRFVNRGYSKGSGKRYRILDRVGCVALLRGRNHRYFGKLGKTLLSAYMVGGLVISAYTIAQTSIYVVGLRRFARESGWLQTQPDAGISSEDDPTAFGQMVPILLSLLTLFAFLEKLSERGSGNRATRRYTIAGTVTPHASAFFGTPKRQASDGPSPTDQDLKNIPTVYQSQLVMTPGSIGGDGTPGPTPMTLDFSHGRTNSIGHGLALDGRTSVATTATMAASLPPQQQQQHPSTYISQNPLPSGPASAPLLAGYTTHPYSPAFMQQQSVAGTADSAVASAASYTIPMPAYFQEQQFQPSPPPQQQQQQGVTPSPPPVYSTQGAPQASVQSLPSGYVIMPVGAPDRTGRRNANGYFPLQSSGSPPRGAESGSLSRRST